jgi:poly-beta-hydroxybutyrate-responsive repressor
VPLKTKRSDVTDEGGGRRQDSEYQGPKPHKAEARPRNWQEPVTLLMLREWSSYGYKMMERMAEFGLEAMNPATLYRTLRHMEKDGLCRSRWDASEGRGPARRVYSITDAGNAYLDLWARSLEQYQRNMDAFFRLYARGLEHRAKQKEDDE